jgi:hypothetical protein
MITILIDHDIEGQAMLLWDSLSLEGWPDVLPLRFIRFTQVDLPINSPDRVVWRFAQENNMVLLTGNRRMREADSLERTLREENNSHALPVITIGRVQRMIERPYRVRCLVRLLEILLELENYRGTARIFIP